MVGTKPLYQEMALMVEVRSTSSQMHKKVLNIRALAGKYRGVYRPNAEVHINIGFDFAGPVIIAGLMSTVPGYAR